MPTPDEAFEALDLPRDAGRAEVVAAKRRLILTHHPDRGGDPVRLQAALAAATIAYRHVGPCTSCDGTGKRSAVRDFVPTFWTCEACDGDGRKK